MSGNKQQVPTMTCWAMQVEVEVCVGMVKDSDIGACVRSEIQNLKINKHLK